MPHRNLHWFGPEPNQDLAVRIHSCAMQYTSEEIDSFDIFGMRNDGDLGTNILTPFLYQRRLFLAVYREDFLVAIEDNHLNIKVLIKDLWGCNPINYLELSFFTEFAQYITDI